MRVFGAGPRIVLAILAASVLAPVSTFAYRSNCNSEKPPGWLPKGP